MTNKFVQVILAAGEGRRAGGYKPLFPFDTGRVIDRVIQAGRTICSEIRIVGGSNFEALELYLKQNFPSVQLVRNALWKEGGMFSSVLTGLTGQDGPVFIHPADIPGPGPNVYRSLASAFEDTTGEGEVFRPIFDGRVGHPILLSPSMTRAVRDADPFSNLRVELVDRKKVDVKIDDKSVLFDLDTQEDFARLEKLLKDKR